MRLCALSWYGMLKSSITNLMIKIFFVGSGPDVGFVSVQNFWEPVYSIIKPTDPKAQFMFFFCKIFLLITKHNITDNVYIRLIKCTQFLHNIKLQITSNM